jgi:hypothetical protein
VCVSHSLKHLLLDENVCSKTDFLIDSSEDLQWNYLNHNCETCNSNLCVYLNSRRLGKTSRGLVHCTIF